MGYRSDVAYTIRFKKEEDYHLFILEAKANPEIAGAVDECNCNKEKMRIDFQASSVKWYESYPDVQMHEKLIDQADEWCKEDDNSPLTQGEGFTANGFTFEARDYRLGFVFLRIGEDTEDVARREGGFAPYEWLYVSRTIEGDIPA